MRCLRLTLLLLLLIFVVPSQSHAYVFQNFLKLAQGNLNSRATDQISTSPSPLPAPSLNFVTAPSPANTAASSNHVNAQTPVNPPTIETCDRVFHKCDVKDYNIIACVPFVGNGSQASYVLVQNVGDNSLQLNLTAIPYNISMEDIAVSGHQVKKVNLPPNTGGSSSVLLKVGFRDCTIQLGASVPESSYARYLTPVNGPYLLFVTVVLIGGTCACYKLGKTGRHLKGVPYKELEMSQQDPDPAFTIESPEGWEDNWDDDDWDVEKAVKSPGVNRRAKNFENGASLKYIDTTQWGNDWDD